MYVSFTEDGRIGATTPYEEYASEDMIEFDFPEDFEFPDALLDEAAAIANDFASLVDQKRYLARTTPIFTRFSVSSVAEDHKASSGADRQ